MKNILLIAFYLTISFLYKYLPFIYYPLMALISKVIFLLVKKRRNIAKINLDYIYDTSLSDKEKEDIILKSFNNYMFALRSFIENYNISKADLEKKITFKNKEIIDKAFKDGRKVIIASGHFGQWEVLILTITAIITNRGAGIAQYTDSPFINDIMHKVREQFGGFVFDRRYGLIKFLKILKNKDDAVLILDQKVTKESGIAVNFLDKPTYYTNTASLMARKYNFVIIPTYINTIDNNNHIVEFHEAIESDKTKTKEEDYKQMCQKQATALEKHIKKDPHLWHWMHKKWEYDVKGMYEKI
jgi:KDO2-lipid IV(A) lauroyltransferase